MLRELGMFELHYPWLLALLPAPFLVWRFLPPHREARESVRIPFFEKAALAVGADPTPGGFVLKRNLLQRVLLPSVWVLLVLAAARPQLVEPPLSRTASARDLMLAVDLSGSMAQRDLLDQEGNRIQRLDGVKDVLDGFIARREGDRIGIIVFGSEAFVQTPFTQDHGLVRVLLDQVEPRMPGPQTMLGDAIGLTIKTYEASEARDRVMVLLTDGNDTGSKVPPLRAAEIAAQEGIVIHTVAVGDPATTGEGQMDMETLESIAAATGGAAFRADDREQLEGIYAQIDALTPEEIETTTYRPTTPLFHWPLAGAVALVLLYHLLLGARVGARRLGAVDA